MPAPWWSTRRRTCRQEGVERLQIALIGHGAIAQSVLAALADDRDGPAISYGLCRPGREAAAAEVFGPGIVVVNLVEQLPVGIDLVVDCAGHGALRDHGEAALLRGMDVLTVSIGALAESGVVDRLSAAARRGRATLHLASGAIGGLDALAAAAEGGLTRVVYTGRKPPAAWRGSAAEEVLDLDDPPAEPVRHFLGDAGEAARRYPKNANVAAAVAMAGVGFADTTVELWADPGVERTIHTVDAEGAFGRLRFEVAGLPLADNPRSSALAAMSVVAHLRRLASPIRR